MLFKDYFDLLKKYCKKKPADADLCRDLFNSIIENTDNADVFIDYDKSVVSRILSGKRGIPGKVRDYVYDDGVNEGIAEYFDKYIIPQLVPMHEDLIHEICRLLESYPNLSKPHLSTLKSLAKEKTLGVFLSEVFRYAILESDSDELQNRYSNDNLTPVSSQITIKKAPVLALYGISEDNNLDNCFIIEKYNDKSDVSRDCFRDKLELLYEQISKIHLPVSTVFSNNSFLSFRDPVKIDDNLIEIIKTIANQLSIHLEDDFFYLGGLSKSLIPSVSVFGTSNSLVGTDDEKKKYHLLKKMEDIISDFSAAIPFINAFDDIRIIRLAVRNTGTMHDENIRISLEFEQGKILSIKQLSEFGPDVYDYIMQESDKDNLFGIPRGNDYLDYGSSIKTIRPKAVHVPGLFGYSYDSDEVNKEEELEDYLGYNTSQKVDKEYLNLEIEEIVHHDAVAFPSMILLTSDVVSIPYRIHSKYMENEVVGTITIKDTTDYITGDKLVTD